jgi:hypothetical protein
MIEKNHIVAFELFYGHLLGQGNKYNLPMNPPLISVPPARISLDGSVGKAKAALMQTQTAKCRVYSGSAVDFPRFIGSRRQPHCPQTAGHQDTLF